MELDFSALNVWAILVATIITMLIGSLWYSTVLFGNTWMKLIQKNREELTNSVGPIIGTVFIALINNFLLATILQWTQAAEIFQGLFVAGLLGLIIILTTTVNYLFENRPMKLMAIQAGFHVVALLVNSVLLTLWK